jgi:ATP-dependent Clp protease protease subunit
VQQSDDAWLSHGIDLENRVLELTGVVAEPMLSFLLRGLIRLNTINHNPITIYLSSAGGNIFDGLAIYDLIRASPSEIIIYASGKICSMGIILLVAGDHRFAGPNTRFMMHEASHSTEGKVRDTKVDVAEVEYQDNMTSKLVVQRTKLTAKQLSAILEKNDHWFGVSAAKKYGILTDKPKARKAKRK